MVDRVRINCAVCVEVVPDHCLALFWRDRAFEPPEARAAAFLDIIQVDHERPGSLAEKLAEHLVLMRARHEVVVVRLVFLFEIVALPLRDVAVGPVDPKRFGHQFIQLHDEIMAEHANIGRERGADLRIPERIGRGGGAQLLVDQVYDAVANVRHEEVVPDIQLRFSRWDFLDVRMAECAAGEGGLREGRVVGVGRGTPAIVRFIHQLADLDFTDSLQTKLATNFERLDTGSKAYPGERQQVFVDLRRHHFCPLLGETVRWIRDGGMTEVRRFIFRLRRLSETYIKNTVHCICLTQIGHKRSVTLMLHRSSITLSLLVLALAAPGLATAETKLAPVNYAAAADVSDSASSSDELGLALLDIANATRAQSALAPMAFDAGLAAVAEAHARDMATRGYVGYADPSGASLLDKVRISDRSALIGSFGSSLAVLDARATAAEIHNAIQSDAGNAENLRRGFTHAGMGTHESGGKLYVVQLFARIDGELERPLPAKVTDASLIQADLYSDDMTPVAWSLNDEQGAVIARGTGRRINGANGKSLEGFLDLDVAVGQDIYTLRGPYVHLN